MIAKGLVDHKLFGWNLKLNKGFYLLLGEF